MEKITNRTALRDYEILETFEAGIVLFGHEVKSVKSGNMNLKGAFVSVNPKKIILQNAHIAKYEKASNIDEYEPYRERELLLNKKEINKLMRARATQGLTIIPISVYCLRNKVKVAIAIARGRKKYDKREVIKKRELEREANRVMKI